MCPQPDAGTLQNCVDAIDAFEIKCNEVIVGLHVHMVNRVYGILSEVSSMSREEVTKFVNLKPNDKDYESDTCVKIRTTFDNLMGDEQQGINRDYTGTSDGLRTASTDLLRQARILVANRSISEDAIKKMDKIFSDLTIALVNPEGMIRVIGLDGLSALTVKKPGGKGEDTVHLDTLNQPLKDFVKQVKGLVPGLDSPTPSPSPDPEGAPAKGLLDKFKKWVHRREQPGGLKDKGPDSDTKNPFGLN